MWWADLGDPVGSAPGYRRPVLVVQGDPLNRSRIATVVCVPVTSQLKWADAPGNVLLTAATSGLDRDSVANVSLIVAIDKVQLIERAGKLTARKLERVLSGVDPVQSRRVTEKNPPPAPPFQGGEEEKAARPMNTPLPTSGRGRGG